MASKNTKLHRDRKLLAAFESGQTTKEIARVFKLSERAVWYGLKRARLERTDSPRVLTPTNAKTVRSELSEEARKMLLWTADAFEEFFNCYSGRILSPIHKQWVQDALDHDRLLINVPPRHAKSTIFSVWFPIWILCGANETQTEPLRDAQILIVSKTHEGIRKFTDEISNALIYNDKLIQDFGAFKPEYGDWPWKPNSGQLMIAGRRREVLSGDMSVRIIGSQQQILGSEANYIICDDPVGDDSRHSEVSRDKLSQWFHGDVMTRLSPNGRAIVIGQRIHTQDLYGELAKEKDDDANETSQWWHINYPAVLNWDTEEVLWPEMWPFDKLKRKYRDVGSQQFSCMYQQEPLSAGMRLATKPWLYGSETHPGCLDLQRNAGSGPRDSTETDVPWVRVLSVDPGLVRNWGLVLADVRHGRDGKLMDVSVVELLRKSMSVRDFMAEIQRIVTGYTPDYILIETNVAKHLLQDQRWDWVKSRVPILSHVTSGSNKGSNTLGVEGLAVDFELGRIRFPYGDADGRVMTEMMFEEVLSYPQGVTDDLLMALWFLYWNYYKFVPRVRSSTVGKPTWHIPPRLTKQKTWSWLQPQRSKV